MQASLCVTLAMHDLSRFRSRELESWCLWLQRTQVGLLVDWFVDVK